MPERDIKERTATLEEGMRQVGLAFTKLEGLLDRRDNTQNDILLKLNTISSKMDRAAEQAIDTAKTNAARFDAHEEKMAKTAQANEDRFRALERIQNEQGVTQTKQDTSRNVIADVFFKAVAFIGFCMTSYLIWLGAKK